MLYHLSVKVSTKIIEMYLWETQYIQQLFIKVIGIKYMIDAMTVYHSSAEHKIHQRGTLPDANSLSQTGLRLVLRQRGCCSLFLRCSSTEQRLLEQRPARAEFTGCQLPALQVEGFDWPGS